MTIKKTLFAILIILSSLEVYSQNAFRVVFNTIITNKTLDDAYKECSRLFNEEHIIGITDDKKMTTFDFSSSGGIITFGKNNLNGKIEGVIIYTRDDIETKWLNDILSSYFHVDDTRGLINNFNKIPCDGYKGYGTNPMFMLNIGNKNFCMKIPIKLN
jgi:hypothetical protein